MSQPFTFAIAFLFLVSGCGTENPFDRGPDFDDESTEALPPGAAISFSNDVMPALSSCISCHASGAGGWTYTGSDGSYASVLDIVNRSSPAESILLIKATGGDSHGGGALFSTNSIEYDTILRWIEQGALND